MIPGLLQQLVSPYQYVRVIAMRANVSLWEEAEKRGEAFWKSEEDRNTCMEILMKEWIHLNDRDIQVVDMLSLKYNDKPCDADLSKERVLH